MGGCMSWTRLMHRNRLTGDYQDYLTFSPGQLIAGDARRLERDQRDERHLARYAAAAGITPEQVKRVLDLFFNEDCEGQTYSPTAVHTPAEERD